MNGQKNLVSLSDAMVHLISHTTDMGNVRLLSSKDKVPSSEKFSIFVTYKYAKFKETPNAFVTFEKNLLSLDEIQFLTHWAKEACVCIATELFKVNKFLQKVTFEVRENENHFLVTLPFEQIMCLRDKEGTYSIPISEDFFE